MVKVRGHVASKERLQQAGGFLAISQGVERTRSTPGLHQEWSMTPKGSQRCRMDRRRSNEDHGWHPSRVLFVMNH